MSTTQVGPQDVISHLAAVYGKLIAENYFNRINVAMAGNPQKDTMVQTMMNWLNESLREVTPGSMVIQVNVTAPPAPQGQVPMGGMNGVMPLGGHQGFPAGGGFSGAPGAMIQAAASNNNIGSCPKDGARELPGLGVTARVPAGPNKPAGAKCGIKFAKKDFGNGKEKFYCILEATEINPHTNTYTCSKHKKNKTTGDTAAKSGARVSPVVAASAIKGINNGLMAPAGVTPNAQQVSQIGGMMTQNPGFIQPVQGGFQNPAFGQQPQQSQQFTIPQQGPSTNPMANQIFNSVGQDLQKMQPQQSIHEGSNQVTFGQQPSNTYQVPSQQQPPPQTQAQFQVPAGGIQFNSSHFINPVPIPQNNASQNDEDDEENEDDEDGDGDEGETSGEEVGSFQAPQQQQSQGQGPVDNAMAQAQQVQMQAPAPAPAGNFDFAKMIAQQQGK